MTRFSPLIKMAIDKYLIVCHNFPVSYSLFRYEFIKCRKAGTQSLETRHRKLHPIWQSGRISYVPTQLMRFFILALDSSWSANIHGTFQSHGLFTVSNIRWG